MFLLLFGLWLLFNARITFDVVIVGLVLSFLLTVFGRKICGWSHKTDMIVMRVSPRLMKFTVCIFFDIIKANLKVMKIILTSNLPEQKPRLFFFDTKLTTEVGKLALANTITITPGTYTVGIYDSTFAVHALTMDFEDGTPDNTFNRQIISMEKFVKGMYPDE